MCRRIALVFAGSVVIAGYSPVSGQQIDPDTPQCPRCTIRLVHRVTFQTDSRVAALEGLPVQVAQTRDRKFIVLVPGQLPLVYGSNGKLLTTIGRRGEGPGEYRAPTFVAPLVGDSVLIVDSQLLRGTVLDADFKLSRTIQFPLRPGPVAILEWPSKVAVNGVSFSPELAGFPLHLFDLSGSGARHIAPLQRERGALRASDTPSQLRRLFQGDQTGFWASHVLEYKLARVTVQGATVQEITRRPSWFSQSSSWSIGSPTRPPPPFIEGAAIVGDTLWVAIRIARPDWQDAWSGIRVPLSGEMSRSQVPDRTELYRSRLEVIHRQSGQLISAGYVNGIVVHVTPDRHILLYRLTDSGEPRLTLHEVVLQSPSR
jgi:hypothetical protein